MRHKRTAELRYPGLSRGCVLEWCPSHTGPTGSTLRDSGPSRRHGTLMNGAAYHVSHGKHAVQFDGSNDYIDIGVDGSFPTNACASHCAWVYKTTDSQVSMIIRSADSNGSGVGLILGNGYLGSANTLISYGRYDGVTAKTLYLSSTVSVPLNQWVHVAGVMESQTTHRIYIGGVESGTTTIASVDPSALTPNAGAIVSIGGFASAGRTVAGSLDDLRVYNRALTPAEIRLLSLRRGIARETVRRHRARRRILRSRQYLQPIGVGIY